MKILKILKSIMFDTKAIFGVDDALLAGTAISAGGSVLGGLFGKQKQSVYDPYADLRNQYKTYLSGKLGTTTPYSYNDKFTLDTPPELQASSNTVLGKLNNLPQTETDLFGVYDKYAKARQASAQEQQNKDLKEQQNMYNRLGLSSSTPYLTDSAELRRKQGIDMDLTNADIARQGVDATQKAYGINNDIAQSWVNSGNVLGQIKQEAQKYGINMSEDDIKRMITEEQGWASEAGGLLGGNPPQVSYSPNTAAQLGQGGQDIGSLLAMYSLLGKK